MKKSDNRTEATATARKEAVTMTAEQATARGYHTIAARLRRGTMTPEQAARLAARLDSISGADFTSAYTAEQAIKGAVRALHAAENFSGGLDMLRELAQQAERAAAIHAGGRPYTQQARAAADKDGQEAETLPDVWDSIQEAAALAVKLAASVGQFAADVVNVLIHWPQIVDAAGGTDEQAAAMPSNRTIAATMQTLAALPFLSVDTVRYAQSTKAATIARRIDRALQAIATTRDAATLAALLREEVAAQHSGKAYIVA